MTLAVKMKIGKDFWDFTVTAPIHRFLTQLQAWPWLSAECREGLREILQKLFILYTSYRLQNASYIQDRTLKCCLKFLNEVSISINEDVTLEIQLRIIVFSYAFSNLGNGAIIPFIIPLIIPLIILPFIIQTSILVFLASFLFSINAL